MSEVKRDNKAWKIASIILNTIFYIFIALLIIFSITNLKRKEEFSIPSLFGKGYLTVRSDSMNGNEKDSFTTKDMIFVDVITDKNRDKKLSKLEVGDIITFIYYVEETNEHESFKETILNTHRIVDILNEDGKIQFVTQGDKVAKETPEYVYDKDADPSTKPSEYFTKYEVINYDSVQAIYTGKWNGFGSFMKFLQSSTGFLVCIVLPTALFFIFEAIMLVLNFAKIKNHKKELATNDAIADKDLALQQAMAKIAELEAQQKNKTDNEEDTSLEETKEKEE